MRSGIQSCTPRLGFPGGLNSNSLNKISTCKVALSYDSYAGLTVDAKSNKIAFQTSRVRIMSSNHAVLEFRGTGALLFVASDANKEAEPGDGGSRCWPAHRPDEPVRLRAVAYHGGPRDGAL